MDEEKDKEATISALEGLIELIRQDDAKVAAVINSPIGENSTALTFIIHGEPSINITVH